MNITLHAFCHILYAHSHRIFKFCKNLDKLFIKKLFEYLY